MANQTGTFSVQFEATPSIAPIDSLGAITSGSQTAFIGLACIARIEVDGELDRHRGQRHRFQYGVQFPGSIIFDAIAVLPPRELF